MYGKYNLDVSILLDNHLPSNGVGTEREKLRILLHSDISTLIKKASHPEQINTLIDQKVEHLSEIESDKKSANRATMQDMEKNEIEINAQIRLLRYLLIT